MPNIPQHIREELENIELPWLLQQQKAGKKRVDGVDIEFRIQAIRDILARDDKNESILFEE